MAELEDGILKLKEEYTERVTKLEARVRQLVQMNTTTQAQLQDSLLASGSLAASQSGRPRPAKPTRLGQSPALKAQQELSEQLARQQQVIDALTEKVGELEQSARVEAPADDDLVVDQEYIERLKKELDEM